MNTTLLSKHINIICSEEEINTKLRNQIQTQIIAERLNDFFLNNIVETQEKTGKKVKQIRMHPEMFSCMRKYGKDIFDYETRIEKLLTGFSASVWGIQISIDKSLPIDQISFITEE